MNASIYEIANLIKGVVVGNDKTFVSSLSSIDELAKGSLVFIDGPNKLTLVENSEVAAIIVGMQVVSKIKTVIQVENPFASFIKLINHYYPSKESFLGVHPTAVIADSVVLGDSISIGPYVTIESGSIIGDNCVIKSHVSIGHNVNIGVCSTLHPHVTIYDNSQIGARVCIHASTVIGSDGFGYILVEGKRVKVPHLGYVLIEDDVEIGANTAIDRATVGATVIGSGTKIDNLVQIAHSVKIGKNNIICAFTGIAGSSISGDDVVFAANVGVSDHVRIDDGVILAARAGVPPNKHLKQGNTYLGNPARPISKAIEQDLSLTRIPFMRKKIKILSDKVIALNDRLEQYETESA